MVYCAGKLMEKIACLLNYYIKAKDHKFLWFIGWDVGRTLEEFKNYYPAARDLRILVFYQHSAWFISLKSIETCGLLLKH